MKILVKIMLGLMLLFLIVTGWMLFYLTRGLAEGATVVIGQIDPSKFVDGIYEGRYNVGRWANQVKVRVATGKIVKIEVVKRVLFERPEITKEVINQVLEKQSTKIDIVSGATVSSKAYLKSIENALTK